MSWRSTAPMVAAKSKGATTSSSMGKRRCETDANQSPGPKPMVVVAGTTAPITSPINDLAASASRFSRPEKNNELRLLALIEMGKGEKAHQCRFTPWLKKKPIIWDEPPINNAATPDTMTPRRPL